MLYYLTIKLDGVYNMNEENKKEVIINIALLISLILLCIMIFFSNYKNHHNIRYLSVKDSPFTYDMIGEWNDNNGMLSVNLNYIQRYINI